MQDDASERKVQSLETLPTACISNFIRYFGFRPSGDDQAVEEYEVAFGRKLLPNSLQRAGFNSWVQPLY
jgi:hypothetical protein